MDTTPARPQVTGAHRRARIVELPYTAEQRDAAYLRIRLKEALMASSDGFVEVRIQVPRNLHAVIMLLSNTRGCKFGDIVLDALRAHMKEQAEDHKDVIGAME